MSLPGLIAASLLAAQGAQGASLVASPLEGTARRPQRARGTGAVAYATAERAYLDAGAADGLASGMSVEVRREGRMVGRCAVDAVAEHQASCAAKGVRVGDTVSFDTSPEPPGPKILPAVVADEELARRAAAVENAPPAPLVEHQVAPGAVRAERTTRHVGVALDGATWSATGADALSVGAIDLWIADAEIGAGIRLDVDARAERWFPNANPRFRPDADTRLYVWRAQLTAPLSAATVAAGRILPIGIPGSTLFDGATGSVRRGALELGLFGGEVPEPDALGFSKDRATGGGFWSYGRDLRRGGGWRTDGRLAVVTTPELGTRYEATIGGRAWLKAADLSGEVQLGAGGKDQAAGYLDAARVDVSVRPTQGFTFGGGYRHAGLEWPQPFEPALFPGRGDAADGFASLDVWKLRVGATGGFSRDAVSDLERKWFGPELAIPRLLGSRGGLTAGYLEERGWLEGRSAYGGVTFRAWEALLLGLRGGWVHEETLGMDRDELSISATADAPLGSHLGLRVYALYRAAVGEEGGGGTPSGVTVQGSLFSRY